MRRAVILLSLIAAIFLLIAAKDLQAQPKRSAANPKTLDQSTSMPQTSAETENLRLQRERLDFDKKKFESDNDFEERKLKIETDKAFWSAFATASPLIIGALAIIVGFWNQSRQAKHQFELKAAEIIFTGTTPQAILNRGKALKAIFGRYLSKNFLSNFKPEDYGGEKEPSEAKKFFIEQILNNPEKKAEITQLWFRVCPGDYKWLVRAYPEEFKDSDLPEIIDLLKGTPFEKKK
jgi:hypothetical protein